MQAGFARQELSMAPTTLDAAVLSLREAVRKLKFECDHDVDGVRQAKSVSAGALHRRLDSTTERNATAEFIPNRRQARYLKPLATSAPPTAHTTHSPERKPSSNLLNPSTCSRRSQPPSSARSQGTPGPSPFSITSIAQHHKDAAEQPQQGATRLSVQQETGHLSARRRASAIGLAQGCDLPQLQDRHQASNRTPDKPATGAREGTVKDPTCSRLPTFDRMRSLRRPVMLLTPLHSQLPYDRLVVHA